MKHGVQRTKELPIFTLPFRVCVLLPILTRLCFSARTWEFPLWIYAVCVLNSVLAAQLAPHYPKPGTMVAPKTGARMSAHVAA